MLKLVKIPFVFGNPTDPYEIFIGTDPTVLAVSRAMVRAWISFTRQVRSVQSSFTS